MGTKALLVGINAYPTMPLNGCVNDVETLAGLLQQQYHVAAENIRVLRDGQATAKGIAEHLRWLAEMDADESEPVRLFHFSGHGTYVEDQNTDEPDGRDEALVPYDYPATAAISDDILRDTYAAFAPQTQLLLVMDCCHSGSIQRNAPDNVRYRFLPNSFEEHGRFRQRAQVVRERRDAYVLEQLSTFRNQQVDDEEWQQLVRAAMAQFDKKHFGVDTVPGNVILLSACRADQTAADAYFGAAPNGAFTYYLAQVLAEAGGKLRYSTLVEQVGRRLYDDKFLQEPQLECSDQSRECGFLNIPL